MLVAAVALLVALPGRETEVPEIPSTYKKIRESERENTEL